MHSAGRRGFALIALGLAAGLVAACGSSSSSTTGSASKSSSAGTSSGSSSSGSGASSSGSQAPAINISIAAAPSAGALPAFVASQQGFFAKHGLNVKTTYLTNPTNLPSALGTTFQFGETYQPILINAAARGIPIVAVAGGQIDKPKTAPLAVVYVRKGSGITSFAQLAGKRVGSPTVTGILADQLLESVKLGGGNPSAVQLVQVPLASEASELKAGRVDAVIGSAPYTTELGADGFASLGDPAAFEGPSAMVTVWAASRPWVQQHQAVLNDFIAALQEGQNWIAAHRNGAIQVYHNVTKIPTSVLDKAVVPSYSAKVAATDVEPWVGYMRDVGVFKGTVNVSSLVYSG